MNSERLWQCAVLLGIPSIFVLCFLIFFPVRYSETQLEKKQWIYSIEVSEWAKVSSQSCTTQRISNTTRRNCTTTYHDKWKPSRYIITFGFDNKTYWETNYTLNCENQETYGCEKITNYKEQYILFFPETSCKVKKDEYMTSEHRDVFAIRQSFMYLYVCSTLEQKAASYQ